MVNILGFWNKKKPEIKPMVLLVLDGYGIAPASAGNAIDLAKTPMMDWLLANFPHGELIAAGESVGLPANEAGNSEVGHLTIGAGRVMLQSLLRINKSIEDGTFFENKALISAIDHAKANNSWLNIIGLVSSGSVHSANGHLYALMELCKRLNFNRVKYHLITDGRDAPPRDALKVNDEVMRKISEIGVGTVVSVIGRYYAMDRDSRWERTKMAYDLIVEGVGERSANLEEAINKSYGQNLSDEFIPPFTLNSGVEIPPGINDGDAVIIFNFRVDRPRQLTMALTMDDFERLHGFEFSDVVEHGKVQVEKKSGPTFVRNKKPKGLFVTTMTMYQKNIPVSAVAFAPQTADVPMAQVVSEANLKQVHMAESEKERMVTHYFNGLRDEKYAGEDTILVNSPKVSTYDKKPEMAVFELVNKFSQTLKKGKYHFFVVNFANPDMVAHSGNVQATIQAIEAVDKAIGQVYAEIRNVAGTLIITADHGNAEDLLSYPTTSFFYTTEQGSQNTEHSSNPVPVVIADPNFLGKPTILPRGDLSDIAPTMLTMMKLPVPGLMTGKDLMYEAAKS